MAVHKLLPRLIFIGVMPVMLLAIIFAIELNATAALMGAIFLSTIATALGYRHISLRLSQALHAQESSEAERRSSEQRFRAAYEQSAVGIVATAPDGQLLRANQKMCDMVGYTLEELQTMTIQQLTHPNDLDNSLAHLRRMLAGEIKTFSLEKRYIHKDGSFVWGNLSCALTMRPDGSPDYLISLVQDIGERVRAKQSLLLSDLALNSISQGVLISGADRRVITVNAAFTKITGYSAAEVMGTRATFLKGPLTDAQVVQAIEVALTEGQDFNADILNYRKDGTTFWNELHISSVRDVSGLVTHYIGVIRDVTDRKLTENKTASDLHLALREQQLAQTRLQFALKGLGAGSFEWNLRNGVQLWSEPLWALYGLEPHIVSASFDTWLQSMHAEDRETTRRIVNAATAQGLEFSVQWRLNLPDHSACRWLLTRANPVLEDDGRIERYLGISIDISERRQSEITLERYRDHLEEMVGERTAELSLAEAEQRRLNRALRLLGSSNVALAHARDESELFTQLCDLVVHTGGYATAWIGLAVYDASKSVTVAAKAGDKHGYLEDIQVSWDIEQAIGRGPMGMAIHHGAMQIVQESDQSLSMEPWREAMRKSGFRSCLMLPIFNDARCIGGLGIYSTEAFGFAPDEAQLLQELSKDIAFGLQALRNRQELAIYQLQLEDKVSARTREIDALNAELTDKVRDANAANEAKGTFLATMSHELRTPLNAVVGLTGLLASSPLGRRQRDYADKIQSSAQALRTLIDDILDFSKIEAGELTLEHAPFSLNSILHVMATVLGVGVREKSIEPLFDVSADVPDALLGDSLRLQQILMNLTSNAVKFTETGAIVISVRCVQLQSDAVTLEFAINDTGIGIASEHLGSIFQGFTQADSSTSRRYGGTGLGLAISARLAGLMGGAITVDSEVDWGSEFRFRVTLGLGMQAEPGVKSDIPSPLNVLIVDDHPVAREVLERACTGLGWSVTAADGGEAGLQALKASAASACDFDVMLLDWHMPQMDGIELLRQAHASPDIGLPLVILMAPAFEQEQAAVASEDYYLDGLLSKPITPAGLHDAVRRAYAGDFTTAILPGDSLSDGRLQGMRLLVAEDNLLNQEVIEQVLTRAGAQVVLVGHGRAAVDALRADRSGFDAVLMDIQMPVMDGYTATRIIKEELGLPDLPIVAVTAHARPEDREKAREAGMVGHIVKPLDVEDLLDLLVQGRMDSTDHGKAVADLVTPHVPLNFALPLPELPGLDMPAAIKSFGGDVQKYRELLTKLIENHGGETDEARRLVQANDLSSATSLLHGLSGMASLLQATTAASAAKQAEEALRDGNVQAVPDLLDGLDAAMRALKETVEKLRAMAL